MEQRIRRRAVVGGRVQGVGFRWATAEEAGRLGVAGRARNLDDGTVEVLMEGERSAVDAMLAWLRRGPASARVDSLAVAAEEPTGETGFAAR